MIAQHGQGEQEHDQARSQERREVGERVRQAEDGAEGGDHAGEPDGEGDGEGAAVERLPQAGKGQPQAEGGLSSPSVDTCSVEQRELSEPAEAPDEERTFWRKRGTWPNARELEGLVECETVTRISGDGQWRVETCDFVVKGGLVGAGTTVYIRKRYTRWHEGEQRFSIKGNETWTLRRSAVHVLKAQALAAAQPDKARAIAQMPRDVGEKRPGEKGEIGARDAKGNRDDTPISQGTQDLIYELRDELLKTGLVDEEKLRRVMLARGLELLACESATASVNGLRTLTTHLGGGPDRSPGQPGKHSKSRGSDREKLAALGVTPADPDPE